MKEHYYIIMIDHDNFHVAFVKKKYFLILSLNGISLGPTLKGVSSQIEKCKK